MFSFTQEERKVVLFLAIVGLLGLGTNFLVKKFTKVESIAYFSQGLGKVNLNSADKSTLMGISGIGDKLAQQIIEYREKSGGFYSIEELKNVKGFTTVKFEKIKEYLIVNQ